MNCTPETYKPKTPEIKNGRSDLDQTLTILPQSLAKPLFEAFARHGLSALNI